MRDVLPQLQEWLACGEPVALATVLDTFRSAPRPAGAKMAINRRGDVAGAVSGGCVEGAVFTAAQDVLLGGEPRVLRFGGTDADEWDVGLPCGGEIEVFVELLETPPAVEFTALAADGCRAALVTAVDGPGHVGAKMLIDSSGRRSGSLGDESLDAAAAELGETSMWQERSQLYEHLGYSLFCDVVAPQPRLLIFGAVDYAIALCALARRCGWRPYVIDPRRQFATAKRFPDAEAVIGAWPEEAIDLLGGIDQATAIAALSHDPKIDDAALALALRSNASYIGAMGSRQAHAHRRERLLDQGHAEEDLARITAPIGLDLGATTAEETALSIMSEIVAVRRGRHGGRLHSAHGRIHAVPA